MSRDDIIAAIAKIELEEFSDGWTVESLEHTAGMDYNKIFVAITQGEHLSVRLLDKTLGCEPYSDGQKTDGQRGDVQLVGYVISSVIGDETEILRIAVAREFKGRGIGNTLIQEYLFSVKENCDRAFLEVREGNHIARKLYEKQGYKNIATRKNYYSNPTENAIIYQLML